MPLDAARLAAEADAHAERLRGPLWRPEPADREGGDWTAALRAIPGPSAEVGREAADRPDVLARLDALGAAVEGLRAEVRAALPAEGDPLAAVREAAGDPRTYDAPDSRRVGVFVRLLPELRRAVGAMKESRGLRSDAGAWEYVVRLGIAVDRGL